MKGSIQVRLSVPSVGIHVTYPKDYVGKKSTFEDSTVFTLSSVPSSITEDELAIALKEVEVQKKSIPRQKLIWTGAYFFGQGDPLAGYGHEQLTAYESAEGIPSTELTPSGERRASPLERAVLIREYEAKERYKDLLS